MKVIDEGHKITGGDIIKVRPVHKTSYYMISQNCIDNILELHSIFDERLVKTTLEIPIKECKGIEDIHQLFFDKYNNILEIGYVPNKNVEIVIKHGE